MSDVIKFGTDGWRALVAEEFTFPNVRLVSQAAASYLRNHLKRDRRRTVIVGYDTRPLGDRFAQVVAEIMGGNGFEVLLTQGPMPTPAISNAIRQHRLQGGVVITASHNPFTYNGFKFKPFYAGPAESQMTRWIEQRLSREPVRRLPLGEGLRKKRIRWVDLAPGYLSLLRNYVEWPILRKARLKVGYDSMLGAGQDLLQRVTAGGRLTIVPVERSGPLKSSHRPEPVGEQLEALGSVVRRHRCDVGLATDGDADRIGLVDSRGRFVSSQQTMCLMLWHMLEDRGWRGMVVTTVAGTNVMDRIAAQFGVPFKRTPVGFKHIARLMRQTQVLFGGEESGGFGFRNTVPERDGLLGGLLILEMMAMRRKGLVELLAELKARFGGWAYSRADLALSKPVDPERLREWAKKAARNSSHLGGGLRFKEIQTLDGAKVILDDQSWLLLRPSGTEPLLRIYAEARSDKQLKTLLKAGQAIGRRLVGK
ncbi:MAG: phosphoglucomutase/phosphomannomutase family protein [Candidatus Omnitrophica bacterium]|nr:phosphoglucomutase/phosphomannomutase family protein [Candidatus Omnitrophota bacterium]